ncbi:MAG: hypothetical protein WBA77_07740 [Microcoleaceae cyanobacterium]
MTQHQIILQKAAQAVTIQLPEKPAPDAVVETLLICEKQAKKQPANYQLQDFLGEWRLCFITGTKKTRKRAGIVLGAGRYLPQWIKITLTYSAISTKPELIENQDFEVGQVQNSVKIGGLQFTLSGPIKLMKHKILAFDFTQATVKLFGLKIYKGQMRGGAESEENFYSQSIQKQAFFAYFLVEDDIIAARGKGGGLAIWGKQQ